MRVRTRLRRVVAAAGAVVALTAVGACDLTAAQATPGAPRTSSAAPRAIPGTAAAALATVAIKGRAPKTGYSRAQFGPAWADTDHDGCDQRNQVLGRDLTAVRYRKAARPCIVLSGTLTDPYTGERIAFVRGQGTSDVVQIDHVVSLSDAWQTGAQALDAGTRELVATDPLNLLAVKGTVNQSKGDGDAATWLPPATGYRCAYVARQVAVKARYELWVTPAEHDAIARTLTSCPAQLLP